MPNEGIHVVLDELVGAAVRVEGGEDVEAYRQRDQGENEGRTPGGALVALQRYETRPEQGHEDQCGQPQAAHQPITRYR